MPAVPVSPLNRFCNQILFSYDLTALPTYILYINSPPAALMLQTFIALMQMPVTPDHHRIVNIIQIPALIRKLILITRRMLLIQAAAGFCAEGSKRKTGIPY